METDTAVRHHVADRFGAIRPVDTVRVVIETEPPRTEDPAGMHDTAHDVKVSERCRRHSLADTDRICEKYASTVGKRQLPTARADVNDRASETEHKGDLLSLLYIGYERREGGDFEFFRCVLKSQSLLFKNREIFPLLLLFGLPQKVTKKAHAVEADAGLRYNELHRFKKRGTQMIAYC